MKEEALKLADQLDGLNSCEPVIIKACEDMIRRLVEELDKQEHCCPDCGCHFVGEYPFNNAPQTKPLSDEEIEECYWGDGYPDNPRHPKEFAYAILRKAQEK